MIATATNKLRFVERRLQTTQIYYDEYGNRAPAFVTRRVLQQWHAYYLSDAAASGKLGEWRDVPMEEET